MKTLYQSLLLALSALALAGTAFAQVPSTNDTSATGGNTGMGSGALGGPNPVNLTGTQNTASGFDALHNNTTGSNNTASGATALASNTTGADNTASGFNALFSNTTGGGNTASGYQALTSNTTGGGNTASGLGALFSNTTGTQNTASGFQALFANTTAVDNTASGYSALFADTTGGGNTASGAFALFKNTTGNNNTASGGAALGSNTTGSENTASGAFALNANTTGADNTASGFNALFADTTGGGNTASGAFALNANTAGNNNTASGGGALSANTTGSNNIAEGYQAGTNLTTGSNNIDIGNVGLAGESNTIRIGTKGTHKATVIAGINTSQVTGSAVYVTTSGRLGVLASSERYKTAITPIGQSTEKLQLLRPVSFHLKADPKGALQYGLIAEDVAKVYPELVIRNEAGRIEGVRYDELAPMLLNQVQVQQRKIDAQAIINASQAAQLHDVQQKLRNLQAALTKLQANEELVANR